MPTDAEPVYDEIQYDAESRVIARYHTVESVTETFDYSHLSESDAAPDPQPDAP